MTETQEVQEVLGVAITAKTIAIHSVITAFGALAHALNAHRSGQSKSFVDFLSLFLISSFTGTMFFLLGFQFLGKDNYLTIVLGGSGGWLGVEGMSFLISILKKSVRAHFN